MEIINLGDGSYKNCHIYEDENTHEAYMAVTDMLNGGITVFRRTSGILEWEFVKTFYMGWGAMWAPYVVKIEDKIWIYVCDTAGVNPYYETMRIYRFMVSDTFDNVELDIERVNVNMDRDHLAMIDPCMFYYQGWWYLAVAILWDPENLRWWDIAVFASRNPHGPFELETMQYIGIGDQHLIPDVVNIDEAFKFIPSFDNHLHCVYSCGDSGVKTGYSVLGHMVSEGMFSEGYLDWVVKPVRLLRNYERLITAPTYYQGKMFATTSENEVTGLQTGFDIAVLSEFD